MTPRRSGLTLLEVTVALGLFAAACGQAPPPPAASVPKGKAPAAAGKKSDAELVERLLAARKEYQGTLEALRAHYIATGDIEKGRWAEDELLQFHRITKPGGTIFLATLDERSRFFKLTGDGPQPVFADSAFRVTGFTSATGDEFFFTTGDGKVYRTSDFASADAVLRTDRRLSDVSVRAPSESPRP